MGSCAQDSGSRIQGPGSWISQQQKILLPRSELANPQALKFVNTIKCNDSLRHLFESGSKAQHSTGKSRQMVESKRCNLQESRHKSGCNDLGASRRMATKQKKFKDETNPDLVHSTSHMKEQCQSRLLSPTNFIASRLEFSNPQPLKILKAQVYRIIIQESEILDLGSWS